MINPLVTVIIPVYNAEHYIEETITSVLNQIYSEFEIIVLDDGSTDRSGEIIKELQKRDSRIIYIFKENTGVSDTRNCGIGKAKGKFIAFLDADDTWEKNNLGEKINAMTVYSKEWAYSDLNIIDSQGQILPGGENILAKDFYKNLLLWYNVVPGPCSNIVVSKDLMSDKIRFDTGLSSPADRDICIQLARKADPVFVDKKLWNYRIHNQSMTSVNKKVVQEMQLMYNKYKKQDYFPDTRTKRIAFSNVYFILAGICFRFTKERWKAVLFIAKSFLESPVNFFHKIQKKIKL